MNRLALMILRNLHHIPGAWFKLCHYARHTDKYPEAEKFNHIRYILQLAVNSGNLNLVVSGKENIPTNTGFIMYGNHQGMFDVLALAATYEGPLAAVFKKELANIPFLKQVIACTKSFAMDREDARQAMTVIRAVTQEVQAGRRYVIFPEGTRSKSGNRMRPFHAGSFRCALKAKCPIVPVAFVDCFKVLDQKGSKPLTVQIHYLKPIPFEEYGDLKTVEVAALVQQRIAEKITECTGETDLLPASASA